MAELNKEPDFILDNVPESMDIICNTPEKVTVRVVKVWNGSPVTQEFTMFADSDRVDVNLVANWQQLKRLLKVSFPIAADNGYASYETSFGSVQRPTNRDNLFGRARFECPVHKWADVTDKSGEFGVSIINDAKYGNDSLRKVMNNGITFVRNQSTVCRVPGVTQWAGNNSYPPVQPYTIDSGIHEVNYAIYPHAGKWEDAQTVNKSYEVNVPMTAFEAAKSAGDGFGASKSIASVNKPSVIITALKNQYDTPEDKNTVVVRVYESSGRDTSGVTLTLPGNIISAKEVNMLEHDYDAAHGYTNYALKNLSVAGDTITFSIGKYEALTIEAKLAPSALPALALPQEPVVLAFN
jgi:alpha-mannosidase